MILTINLLSKIPRAPSQIGRNGWFTHYLNIQCAKNLKHLDGNSSYKRIDSVNEPSCDTSDRRSFLKVVVVRAAEEEEVWNKKSHQEDAMGGRSATNNFNSHQQLLPKTAPSSAPPANDRNRKVYIFVAG